MDKFTDNRIDRNVDVLFHLDYLVENDSKNDEILMNTQGNSLKLPEIK